MPSCICFPPEHNAGSFRVINELPIMQIGYDGFEELRSDPVCTPDPRLPLTGTVLPGLQRTADQRGRA